MSRHDPPSTCRWTCCSASRRRCIATPRIRRAPRWPELDTAALDLRRSRPARARASDGRSEDLPDHHRRSHRRRPDRARPDGRPVAGAGGRLRDHAGRFRRLRRRSDGDGRAHAAGAARCRRRRAHGGRRGDHQPVRRAGRDRSSASSCRRTGWPRPAIRARTRALFDAVQGGRHGTVPGSSDLSIPVGKDSLSMQAQWQPTAAPQKSGVAGVADRLRVRAGRRRARATHAAARARCATPSSG